MPNCSGSGRGNGVPYQVINVLMQWSAAIEKGYTAPIWMTFRQAKELGAHVRKGFRFFLPPRGTHYEHAA